MNDTVMSKDIYLTPVGLKKLKDEHKELTEVKRKEITERISKAREFGDLSENSEYDTAREEQSFTEGRIIEIEEILKHASVISEKIKHNIVEMGSKIKVDIDGNKEEFYIVSSVEANPSEGKISNESPVGRALLGAKVGDKVTISSTITSVYKILEVR
ncbi:transcription elongation factor GreA [Patescibacteria group bacterium]|nr:transcription elongation factor GreA [Patescibacteria group bacterium]